ncbi:MAG: EAL domain-containing protein [Xanthobacteraceae bacterium]
MSKPQSLRTKLIFLVVAAVGATTTVATAISVWQQVSSYSAMRRQALIATAQVLAAAAGSATAERNELEAFQSLRAIGRMPNIEQAEIRTPDGRRLATAGSSTHLIDDLSISPDQDVSIHQLLASGTVQVKVPVLNAGDQVGELVLIGGISDLWSKLLYTFLLTMAGGVFALFAGILVALRLQRKVTAPIYNLVKAMTAVRETHRYDIVVPNAPDRETGELVTGFNQMLRDVRERDERLETHRQTLEQDVADRTRDLKDARDLAESANRAKSEFLATMSHEIRTPMNGIMVMADILTGGELPARQRRYAEIIAKSGRGLLSIINDILDFSKIEAGKLELEEIDVDLNEIAENVTGLFAEQARSKGVDLAAWVDPALPRAVRGDPVRLTQVVTNLVNNALKFTTEGSVKISIRFVAEDRSKIEIAVRDSGIGIPGDKLGTIFESFSQADQSTTRQFGGTGLGLTICKRLATAMGGDIGVISKVGEGSTFSIVIPCRGAGESYWPELSLSVGEPSVCIVDVAGDATAEALAGYFAAAGFDARKPSEIAEKASPRIICVDAARIGAYVPSAHTVLLALSDFNAEEPPAGNADAVIPKPLLRSDVEALLPRIVRGEKLTRTREFTKVNSSAQIAPFEKFTVLVADDNVVNREVAMEALKGLGGVVTLAENGVQALAAMKSARFDIVFMDGSMPEMDGLTASRHVRNFEAETKTPRTPIVGLTAHVVGVDAQKWRDAGMDAVVYKPFTIAELARKIEKLLPHLTRNPALANDTRQKDAPHSEKGEDDGAADLIDGEIFGQLIEMQSVSHENFAQRIIGLYAQNAPMAVAQMEEAAARADADGCARAAHSLKSMSYNVGASRVAQLANDIEISSRQNGLPPTAANIAAVQQAFSATMRAIGARRRGVNQNDRPEVLEMPTANVQSADPMERIVQQAFEKKQFYVVYQPIVDRTGANTTGVEALLRLKSELEQAIPPSVFIPIAEKTGLIHELGNWVMLRAFEDSREWTGADISINVSPVQFLRPDFVGRAERAISESGIDPGRVVLEITESTLLSAENSVRGLMDHLCATGFRFALDDFGTGYASLTSLRRYPFERIKIDRSFVGNLQTTADATIVHAVIAIAKSLGLKVVAEGVEQPEQQKFLASAGVNFMQGYLFGRPMLKEEITARLRSERRTPRAAGV